MESIHLEVRGRVQGVGFRWFVVEKAHQLNVAGWVKNRPDGNVEVAAAGPRDAIERLETALKVGPRSARIEEVKVLQPLPAESLPLPFEIAR